ncbi:hypothetical protein MRX96_036885 [Rhipicephalus microplus]
MPSEPATRHFTLGWSFPKSLAPRGRKAVQKARHAPDSQGFVADFGKPGNIPFLHIPPLSLFYLPLRTLPLSELCFPATIRSFFRELRV